jgi:hypothetical protein
VSEPTKAAPCAEPTTRPITFDHDSVLAIMRGTKTQTRRILHTPKRVREFYAKQDWPNGRTTWSELEYGIAGTPETGEFWFLVAGDHGYGGPARSPYGVPGDLLYVREKWVWCGKGHPLYYADPTETNGIVDASTCHFQNYRTREAIGGWASPMLMPRELSRITLRVTGVRVERLHQITAREAMKEGAPIASLDEHLTPEANTALMALPIEQRKAALRLMALEGFSANAPLPPRKWFISEWDRINGKRASWDSNPLVWVYDFEVVAIADPDGGAR